MILTMLLINNIVIVFILTQIFIFYANLKILNRIILILYPNYMKTFLINIVYYFKMDLFQMDQFQMINYYMKIK